MVERTINVERLEQMTDIFGSFDENIGILERELGVTVLNRNTELKVVGEEERAERAVRVIESLLVLSSRGEAINEQNIRYAIGLVEENKEGQIAELSRDIICITTKGKPIKPKTIGQRDYVNAIANNTITLGIGPAGTGKTYLAVAAAVNAFREKKVNRIILTRPAIEAGEKLGFLPGDLQSKVDPYLRPLYDGLYDMIGPEAFQRYMERGTIEVAPLAYMRGRTLDDSFIILDEAQNTTPEQMKMFLTRLGFNSKAVITGDITQIDLPDGKSSGLRDAMKVLTDIEDVAQCHLTSKDVVRHVLVQRIINAYEKRDREREKKIQQIRQGGKNGRA
ncbi:MAG: PhoH family protein [Oscillospiraceae bacterium]|nr:PhoH family protein [Oscillospiraceae bacterium]